jgi:hypothetical protein
MKSIGLLLLIFATFLAVNGQEQQNERQQDTLQKKPQFYNIELFLTQPTVLPPRSSGGPQDSFSDFPRQSLSVPMPPFSWTFKTNIDLETSWKQELAKQEEYRTWKSILGSIEMGGVAYLTYLHLKKYGLK